MYAYCRRLYVFFRKKINTLGLKNAFSLIIATIFLSHLSIRNLFSHGAIKLALLSFKRKGQRKGSAINEKGTWADFYGFFTGCVITGANLSQGNTGYFWRYYQCLTLAIVGVVLTLVAATRSSYWLPSG